MPSHCKVLFRYSAALGESAVVHGHYRLYLHGLLKFHRHLGIPYVPRKSITHLQTDTRFESDSEKHFPRSGRSITAGSHSMKDLFSDKNRGELLKTHGAISEHLSVSWDSFF